MARIGASTSTGPPAAAKLLPHRKSDPNPRGMPTPAQVQGMLSKLITTTPIPKLDLNGPGMNSNVTPLKRIPRVDADECVGCNLCSLVCPVEDCIAMERVENGLSPQTWEERSAVSSH